MRGHIRKRGSTYSIVVDVGRDEYGKRKQKWYSGFKTKKEAEKALADIIAKIEKGEYFEPANITVAQYLDYWLDTYAKINVAPSTYRRYTEFAAHIKSHNIGKIILPKLKPAHIQGFYSFLLEKNLSKSTVLKIHRMFRLSLKHAVNWQFIISNPADAVTPPRPDKVEMQVWDIETSKKFLNDIADTPIFIPVLLALQTGMRSGEICGLKWEYVDLSRGFLIVKYALQRINGVLALKEPKTTKSMRTIALMDYTVQALKEHKRKQNKIKLLMGSAYNDQDFVCAWEDGRPYDPHYLGQKFTKLIKQLGYPKIRFHDLRHTHATMLLQQGINPKIVSERLGHSQISVTLDTYSHVLPNIQKEAVSRMEKLFAN